MKQYSIVAFNGSTELGRFIITAAPNVGQINITNEVYKSFPQLKANNNARIYINGVPVPRKAMGQTMIKTEE